MNELTCVICGKSLTGGTDTFGDIGVEMCQADWFEMLAEWDTFVQLQNIIATEERPKHNSGSTGSEPWPKRSLPGA